MKISSCRGWEMREIAQRDFKMTPRVCSCLEMMKVLLAIGTPMTIDGASGASEVQTCRNQKLLDSGLLLPIDCYASMDIHLL